MRSRREIAFRLRQESGNLWLLLRQPEFTGAAAQRKLLPCPAAFLPGLRATPYAVEMERLAERILHHDFPILGMSVQTGPRIRWRRDYVHNIETGLDYFRRIPYLDAARAGDHKIVWELNRHQHLVALAQAHLLTGREDFLEELWAQLASWIAENPFQRGINWSSVLEVAFRALSWIWIDHLAGARMPAPLRRQFLTALYRHGLHLALNLSIYFSPNTHLLGEAVALHALGALYPAFPDAPAWAENGARLVREQMHAQVRGDGSHFEQSSWYHVYAVDFFLFHALLADVPEEYRASLRKMADYLAVLTGPVGPMPSFGDDDGGRLFHPYARRENLGRPTLAACSAYFGGPWPHSEEDAREQAAWWCGSITAQPAPPPAASILFPESGLAVMTAGPLRIYADAGPFGPGRAGHSHSDTLSVVARFGKTDLLIDPGTCTYVADPAWRNRFRGSAAHNTVRIDGRDQAVPAGPFWWQDKPSVQIREWKPAPDRDYLDAICRYAGFTHRRRFFFLKPDLLVLVDDIEGPPGEHKLEWFWHLGNLEAAPARIILEDGLEVRTETGGDYGWTAPLFGAKTEAPLLHVMRDTALPFQSAAALWLGSGPATLRRKQEELTVHLPGRQVRLL